MLPATYVCTTFFPYLNLSNIATTFGRRKLAQFSRVYVFGKTNFKFQRILFSLQKHLWKKHLWKKLSNERKSRRSPFTIFFYSYVIYASRINKLINSKYFPPFVFEFLSSFAPRKNHIFVSQRHCETAVRLKRAASTWMSDDLSVWDLESAPRAHELPASS